MLVDPDERGLGVFGLQLTKPTMNARSKTGKTRDSDRLINITAKEIEEWESSCTVKLVKTSRYSLPDHRTSEVNLSCTGEGHTWRTREIWHVEKVSNRKIFMRIQLSTSDYREEGGKK